MLHTEYQPGVVSMVKIGVIALLLLLMLAAYRYGRRRHNQVRRRREQILERLRRQHEGTE